VPHYNFKKDFPIAQETEREVAALLVKLYDAEILGFEDTNKYDILAKIKGVEYKFESKEDFICETTGNIGLEFSCRNKPSGIQVSQADFYIYKAHTKKGIVFIMHNTKTIKNMIARKEYFRIVNGGDKGSNSLNYLFKYDVFIKRARILPLDKI
jgi:hypothetical protein